jgi:hypothetical protein
MLRLFLFCVLLVCSLPAANAGIREWLERQMSRPAVDHGYWECSSCSIPAFTAPVSTTALPDINAFIEAINGELFQGKLVARWIPNSWITVCSAGSCITVYYQAATKLWLPRAPSFPLPPGKTPKTPQAEPPQVNNEPGGGGDAAAVTLAPVGPVLCLDCGFAITMPGVYSPPRELIPSVTIIQAGYPSVTFRGESASDMRGMNDRLGDRLDWDFWESGGLDDYPDRGGECFSGCR